MWFNTVAVKMVSRRYSADCDTQMPRGKHPDSSSSAGILGSQGAFIATSQFLVEGMTSEGYGSRNRKCVFTDETKQEQRTGLG